MSFRDTARHADETDIIYPAVIPFALIHLACFAVIWTGFQASDLMLCGVLYAIRMFAITGGYHRYFSHRSFKTSRVFQFLLAFVAQSSAQQGALWWAAHHRKHHKYSDTPQDVHSPLQSGFWFAHFGWIFFGNQAPSGLRPDEGFYEISRARLAQQVQTRTTSAVGSRGVVGFRLVWTGGRFFH